MSLELSIANARDYLRGRDIEARAVTELGGGVSNTMLLVETGRGRFVLKQALPQLRVADRWLADRSRVLREMSALADGARLLSPRAVPRVLWADEPNFLFAMSVVEGHAWKNELFAGHIDPATARRTGDLLARFIAGSWGSRDFQARYGDQTAFEQLRIDPYYRTIARRRTEVAPAIERLIAASAARRVSLVHGDWSPKNLIVNGEDVAIIDFEVVHFGDPSFDAAFCLNHLLLKWIVLPQWRAALAAATDAFWKTLIAGLPGQASWFEPAALEHLGALMLARVDGKSPAEYLDTPELCERVRRVARRLIEQSPPRLREVWPRLE